MFTVSLFIPIFMGCGAWALAAGAAPEKPIQENYLALIGLGIALISIAVLPIPYVFRWNWETRYFGAAMLSLSSASIIGLYPVLCIAQYSSLPLLARLALVLLEGILIIRWCKRFTNIYRMIYSDENLFKLLYTEEISAVYFSQQADKKIAGKILKFEQFPADKYFIVCGVLAFSLIPFATPASQFIGVPFIHIFLAVLGTPLNLLFLGLGTKSWLAFYFYPMKIKRETNKPVFVDISSKAPKNLK
jgi:hypothetical protein